MEYSLDLDGVQVGPVLLLLREAVPEDFHVRPSDHLRKGALKLPEASSGEHSWFDFGDFRKVHTVVRLDASYRVPRFVFSFVKKLLGVNTRYFVIPNVWWGRGARKEGAFFGSGEGGHPPSAFLERVEEKFLLPALHVLRSEDSLNSLDQGAVYLSRKVLKDPRMGLPSSSIRPSGQYRYEGYTCKLE